MNKFKVPELPQKIQIGIQDGYCNLRCPMCFLHSGSRKVDLSKMRGRMSLENLSRILNETESSKPTIIPNRWSEPLLTKNFCEYLELIKGRNLPVFINTNGLLLTQDMAEFMVKVKLDSITFSIDAMTPESLKKMRGFSSIKRLNKAVFRMLKARGKKDYPRIGVSFTETDENKHEKNNFIDFWLNYADVVRIIKLYKSDKSIENLKVPEKRIPCHHIYNSLVVNYKGDVLICCLDALDEVKIGNIFKEGVRKIWHGDGFKKIRHYHETGQYEKIPFCKNCSTWAFYQYNEKIVKGVLIRESPIITFYNRQDKLNTWKKG
ncbi:MAG: SPASM domain-containing protein [Candidatus Omnitrophica bacterium]|nr:SPASM domain-containing protein [Candidatus Omnitrophota bacterium]